MIIWYKIKEIYITKILTHIIQGICSKGVMLVTQRIQREDLFKMYMKYQSSQIKY
jgi:hypothetical protein